MNFKHGKEFALDTIECAVRREIHQYMQDCNGYHVAGPSISDLITKSIRVALEELLRQQYTDEDLEEDLHLIPKNLV